MMMEDSNPSPISIRKKGLQKPGPKATSHLLNIVEGPGGKGNVVKSGLEQQS